jgi:hypothetical protein
MQITTLKAGLTAATAFAGSVTHSSATTDIRRNRGLARKFKSIARRMKYGSKQN